MRLHVFSEAVDDNPKLQHNGLLNPSPLSKTHGPPSAIDSPSLSRNRKSLYNSDDFILLTRPSNTNPSSSSSGTSSAVGQGYTAYGRTFTLGISYRF